MEFEFTKEELDVISQYLARKLDRLEEVNLTDSYCYPRMLTFRIKVMDLQKKMGNGDTIKLQTKESN